VVDEKIGRVLNALGDVGDPDSLRSRTVIFRCADHGEMGLSHGGLRQKAFNTYEETIHIPLVISNHPDLEEEVVRRGYRYVHEPVAGDKAEQYDDDGRRVPGREQQAGQRDQQEQLVAGEGGSSVRCPVEPGAEQRPGDQRREGRGSDDGTG